MIYLRSRYYDPEICRFISEDPIMDGANWYSYCNGNPVMFADPWGMAFKFKNNDEYEYFKNQLYDIYGTTELSFTYDKDKYVLSGISGGTLKRGSHTGISLIGLLASDKDVYKISFDSTSSGGGASGNAPGNKYRGEARIGLLDINGSGDYAIDSEIQSTIVHEFTHLYTHSRGYDTMVSNALRFDVQNWADIKRGYQEATAITVEEKFREEMEYQKRNVALLGGIGVESNSYVTWPWLSKLKYGDYKFMDNCGISLMKSVFLWYDIQQNFERSIR